MKLPKFLRIQIDRNRVYGLDILRAMAILFVVFGHGSSLLPKSISDFHSYFIFDGVAIFFVLSGFLIGRILIKHFEYGNVSIKALSSFWSRRWLRTLPAYYFILVLLAALTYKTGSKYPFWEAKRYFIFLQNFSYPHPNFFPEAWSLSIEEWFYLLIPIMLASLVRLFRFSIKRSVLTVAISIIIITIAFRYFRYSHIPAVNLEQWDLLFRKQVITRLDSLMFGIFGAYWANYHRESWVKLKSPLFMAGISILIIQHIINCGNLLGFGLYSCVYSFTVSAIGVLLLLPYLSEFKAGSGFTYNIITYIALISYSMYLLNRNVMSLITCSIIQSSYLGTISLSFLKKFHLITIVTYSMYWALTITGSLLMYKFIEKPFTNMRSER